MRDMVWRTEDGKFIVIAAMKTAQIHSALRLIRKRAEEGRPWRTEYIERLELELYIRGLQGRS
jgi:hypothetical protein